MFNLSALTDITYTSKC